jgi:tRNA pseudouridine38-40 synthase
LTKAHVDSYGEEIRLSFEAPSFLHHQVRNMVGTLAYVGQGKWKPCDIKTAFEKRERRAGGPTAPPQGLYFTKVFY